MTTKISKTLYWTPRIICILFIPFIMMFSLDVFSEAKSAREIAIGLFMHNIPAFLLILILWATWKREWIGAALFGGLGVFYIWWAGGRFGWQALAFISGPLFLMSALFLIGWLYRKELRGTDASNTSNTNQNVLPPQTGIVLLALALTASLLTGCATFRSDLGHRYEGQVRRNEAKPVSVCFVFSHVSQMVGMDAIPKLQDKYQRLQDFDDIIIDAHRELSNLGQYSTFTDEASDVNDPARRKLKDSLMTAQDYTIKMRIETKKKFSNYFLGALASSISATILPVPYYQYYTVTTDVFNHDRKLIATYTRSATLTKWVEALLIVAYPFHPEERKREEIYMAFLHDTFKQIESEGVLK
jgi:hypothetical protein